MSDATTHGEKYDHDVTMGELRFIKQMLDEVPAGSVCEHRRRVEPVALQAILTWADTCVSPDEEAHQQAVFHVLETIRAEAYFDQTKIGLGSLIDELRKRFRMECGPMSFDEVRKAIPRIAKIVEDGDELELDSVTSDELVRIAQIIAAIKDRGVKGEDLPVINGIVDTASLFARALAMKVLADCCSRQAQVDRALCVADRAISN